MGNTLASGEWVLTHRRGDEILDRWVRPNRIFNTGLNNFLSARLKGTASVARSTWRVGLIVGESTAVAAGIAAGDTPSSTSLGWSESTNYSETVRQKVVFGTVASQAVSSTASPATFTIATPTTATVDVGGAFLISSSGKGNIGTTNEVGSDMHAGVAFGFTRTVKAGDSLDVAYRGTMAYSNT